MGNRERLAGKVWPSRDDFYAGRGGTFSGESDYGHFNWDDETAGVGVFPANAMIYRRLMVCHVHDTGDWYSVDSSGIGEVTLLGTVASNVPEPEVYAFFSDWAQNDGPGRPLSWFRQRIADFNRKVALERANEEVNR